ncbi:50S ribosomal protein L10 [Cardinium endosymbiont of Culicoides punctatus]|uniref:50S ribosomal protein L10 n=1 Tax=Cardinium endosymbiont of Culicoides punctatus TaxID=2304601 RepID=UPI001058FC69|nr:50S ribosomal protein L10 [Cardinium endosymbiont of Culicoides punctatus]TDG95454.1 50S ribosomal protein L10 [Cardinium endosymbiont of Culicoides punctatus]
MKREEKLQVIGDLAEKFSQFECFYVIDAMGLTVEQVNKFRKKCLAQNLVYQVAKNTFIQKALEQIGKGDAYAAFFARVLKGFSGILFAQDSGSAPAKMLKNFLTEEKLSVPTLKGASVYGDVFIGAEHLDMLSTLKSKEEILGDIISLLKSPISNVVTSLQSGERRLMGVMETLANASV